ncbi:23S rRNA (guanosine(2251)-2'-O)-methyltransferase RlmB [uncultured Anaerococcus sp.]|uniref:23S rRNA (guanosine(2251)-2'-O)-methyltransferase RlmB n=1 Tax=uncultured Anaerococcus sp. TaxID=293428 RepID=UPI00280B2E5B|nr:23S rRNA (guanosine(2251)-2'-O)-methyltransferase RlmB [uncultured Anaerococcus sp.]MDU5148985.1 23S rRNA (guanosine(2251)-2'-O)-methyltransferase RlmB [Anaerococcus prevotii]
MDKIYGRKPVLDTLDTDIKIYKAYILKQNSKLVNKIINKLEEKNIEISFVDKRFFDKIDINHQGVMIEVESFKYESLDDLNDEKRLIILDQIEDPHNLGAIIRSAESFGFDGVVIPERRSASVTSTVYKTSAGAINNIKVYRVKNLTRSIKDLKDKGFWIYGLAGEADSSIDKADLTGKVGLVVGNEGSGISRLVRDNCDMLVNIPMLGRVNSLNASVAAGISMYELLRQNGFN